MIRTMILLKHVEKKDVRNDGSNCSVFARIRWNEATGNLFCIEASQRLC